MTSVYEIKQATGAFAGYDSGGSNAFAGQPFYVEADVYIFPVTQAAYYVINSLSPGSAPSAYLWKLVGGSKTLATLEFDVSSDGIANKVTWESGGNQELPTETWLAVKAGWDGSEIYVEVEGQRTAVPLAAYNPTATISTYWVGGSTVSSVRDGFQIANIHVWENNGARDILWKCDEGSGLVMNDSNGTHHGTINDAAIHVEGVGGGPAPPPIEGPTVYEIVTGNDAYVDITADLLPSFGPFSVQFDLYRIDQPGHHYYAMAGSSFGSAPPAYRWKIFSHVSSPGSLSLELVVDSGELVLDWDDGGGNSTLPDNTWVRVRAGWDGTNAFIDVDNVIKQQPAVYAAYSSSVEYHIGGTNTGTAFGTYQIANVIISEDGVDDKVYYCNEGTGTVSVDSNGPYNGVISNTVIHQPALGDGPPEIEPEVGAVITAHPEARVVQVPEGVTFSAGASGNPIPAVSWIVSTDGGAVFQNVLNIHPSAIGHNSTTLQIPATTVEVDGYLYAMQAYNGKGSIATSNAAPLTVLAEENPPTSGDFNATSSDESAVVTWECNIASGDGNWNPALGGQFPLSDASILNNTRTLRLNSVTMGDTGLVRAHATTAENPEGVYSQECSISIQPPADEAPVITSLSTPQVLSSAGVMVFNVEAEGQGTLSYEWLSDAGGTFDDVDSVLTSPEGGNTASLKLNPAQPADSGNLKVIVSNEYGSTEALTAATVGNPAVLFETNFSTAGAAGWNWDTDQAPPPMFDDMLGNMPAGPAAPDDDKNRWECIPNPYDGESGYVMQYGGNLNSYDDVSLIKHLTQDRFAGYTDLYVRQTIRYSDNFITEVSTNQPWDMLRLQAGSDYPQDDSWLEARPASRFVRQEVSTGHWRTRWASNEGGDLAGGSDFARHVTDNELGWDPGYLTNPSTCGYSWFHIGSPDGGLGAEGDLAMAPPYNTFKYTQEDRGWHTIETRIKMANGPEAGDAIAQVWFDGVEQERPVNTEVTTPVANVNPELPIDEAPTTYNGGACAWNLLQIHGAFGGRARWSQREPWWRIKDIVVSTEPIGHSYIAGETDINLAAPTASHASTDFMILQEPGDVTFTIGSTADPTMAFMLATEVSSLYPVSFRWFARRTHASTNEWIAVEQIEELQNYDTETRLGAQWFSKYVWRDLSDTAHDGYYFCEITEHRPEGDVIHATRACKYTITRGL